MHYRSLHFYQGQSLLPDFWKTCQELCQSCGFGPVRSCQFLSLTPLAVTALHSSRNSSPTIRQSQHSNHPQGPELPALSTVRPQRLEQALLLSLLPPPPQLELFIFFLPKQFSTNTLGGPDHSFQKHVGIILLLSPQPQPNPINSLTPLLDFL